MKIRINGNSIRYRLSKPEVDKMCLSGKISNEINFGDNQLKYSLVAQENIDQLTAQYLKGEIIIFIPSNYLTDWTTNDTVGFENTIELENQEILKILIEKDFKCLDNSSEDQSDNFENPNQTC